MWSNMDVILKTKRPDANYFSPQCSNNDRCIDCVEQCQVDGRGYTVSVVMLELKSAFFFFKLHSDTVTADVKNQKLLLTRLQGDSTTYDVDTFTRIEPLVHGLLLY